jgi:hypothetical protein
MGQTMPTRPPLFNYVEPNFIFNCVMSLIQREEGEIQDPNGSLGDQSQGRGEGAISGGARSVLSKPLEQQAAENVATAFAMENARLKAELSAFDREFFDELEELKYKYAQLQVPQALFTKSL